MRWKSQEEKQLLQLVTPVALASTPGVLSLLCPDSFSQVSLIRYQVVSETHHH